MDERTGLDCEKEKSSISMRECIKIWLENEVENWQQIYM